MLVRCLVFVLRLYRWTISPLLGPVCRFHPSCSRYAEGCLLTHGLLYGSLLTLKRLAKCHPFHPGGIDPVPPARGKEAGTPADGGTTDGSHPMRCQEFALAAHSSKGHA